MSDPGLPRMDAAASSLFASAFGAGRGLPPALAHEDADIVACLLSGQPAENARLRIINFPDGPHPSMCFLVEKSQAGDGEIPDEHSFWAERWVEDDGTVNYVLSAGFAQDDLSAPVGLRCRSAGSRYSLTTQGELLLECRYAAGSGES